MQVGKTVMSDFSWRRPPSGWPTAEAEHAEAGRDSAQEARCAGSRPQQLPAHAEEANS